MYKRVFIGWLMLICLLLSGCCEKKSKVYQADKSVLYTALKKKDEIEEERYTTASYSAFCAAVAEGFKLAEDENARQIQVDQAAAKINEQVDVLEVATQGIYLIKTDLNMISNDSVGNNWVTSVLCDGRLFDGEEELVAELNSSVTVTARVAEQDDIPDCGGGSVDLILKNGASAAKVITVQENRGRYSGNKAQWKLKCTVTLLSRI